ncbi:MAG: N-6 DNA methylase [Sandaracinaceae bacterium]
MTDVLTRFHESWLGMVQPIEGLVLSVPVLADAQVGRPDASPTALAEKLVALCPPTRTTEAGDAGHRITDLGAFFAELLGLTSEVLRAAPDLSDALSLYVPEGKQTIRPTFGLVRMQAVDVSASASPAVQAGAPFYALIWDLADPVTGAGPAGVGLSLDKPETLTGTWDYPPTAKLDRLLRHCQVPIGILTNREVVRLVYAPHGESSGHITFRLDDMATVGGRPILDAFVSLLCAQRFFGVAEDRSLPALLAESRKRQANVTTELAEQVFEALQILLSGFQAAADRDPAYARVLTDARQRDHDHLYRGLLTALLRLVFVLYAEDRGLLPVEHPFYARNLSVLGLFERLQRDRGAYPDAMSRRFGAWGRLIALFRAVYLGVDHGDLHMPPRRGALFDPHTYPFLEGWGPAGSAPAGDPEAQARVAVPTVDDETVHRVLEKLVMFEGQRLSYKALDVEQIGSVYEALMGYHVEPLADDGACLRGSGVWVTTHDVLVAQSSRTRAKWLKEEVGLPKAQAEKLAAEIDAIEGQGKAGSTSPAQREAVLDALTKYARGGRKKDLSAVVAKKGRLVLQPGAERRRTSSHYTPRSLTEPIVKRTLEPLFACMGEAPTSERLLELKVCDPAMGSGAFLVEACRVLADQLVAAWTREGKLEDVARDAPNEDPVLHARRLAAQRCLYGVDKNEAAVELAKLSLWLVTLARDLPFTFLDHALRHGDSLVGLSFDQIRAFHWKDEKQTELGANVLREALDEAVAIRQRILALAADPSPEGQREKERLVADAADASARARLLADVVVGAFFAHAKDKDRENERKARLVLVRKWLEEGDEEAGETLRGMQAQLRERVPAFHWMLEFPEVFFAERPDPLDENRVNRAAMMDAFIGNPPFAGKNGITESGGPGYLEWLQALHEGAHGNADLSAHFFLRSGELIGAHGTIGLIATNTIAQGDTRATGLQRLVAEGFTIYDATRSMMWPGDAAVSVAVVHLAKGRPARDLAARLDGAAVPAISSALRAGAERGDAVKLASNAGFSFQGSIVLGMGFTLTPEERDALVARDPRNAERIFPYLGGQEVNTSPTQSHDRYVISFGQMSLEEAEKWPDLLAIVREKVKPERDKLKDNVDGNDYKARWWQFAKIRRGLDEAIANLDRCLVTARVSKHLLISLQPTDRVFSEQLLVFTLSASTSFAVLQSRIHEPWARLLSSSMKNDLRYAASDCFETFPFPQPDPRTVIPALEDVGARLYDARAAYMVDTQQGLTQTYNRLKDPAETDARILALRRLHEEMDVAVLHAYGWNDLAVPPFCPMDDDDRAALEAFSAEVIDRLYVLNAERAADEARKGTGATGAKAAGKGKAPRKKKGAPESGGSQGSLDLG